MRYSLFSRIASGLRFVATMARRLWRRESPVKGGELIADYRRLTERLFPELYRLDDPLIVRQVMRSATGHSGRIGRTVVIIAGITLVLSSVVIPMLLRWTATIGLSGGGGAGEFFLRMAGGILSVLVAVHVSLRIHHRRLARSVRTELNARGLWTCLACGYDLTGNASGRCPECGDPVPVCAEQAEVGGTGQVNAADPTDE